MRWSRLRYLLEGEQIPRFYGVAWQEPWRASVVIFPIPLNWIARWGWLFWGRLRGPRAFSKQEKLRSCAKEIEKLFMEAPIQTFKNPDGSVTFPKDAQWRAGRIADEVCKLLDLVK